MAEKVNITSKGIQKVLKNYNERQAIAEYIWNGFDAHADTINIDYSFNELGGLETLEITDNGYGIDFNRLKQKFDPFYESEKAVQIVTPKHTSKMHGRNGVGRLTFFTFANSATWNTTYKLGDEYFHGSINIDTKGLNDYTYDFSSTPAKSAETGTRVSFLNMRISKVDLELSIIPFLINEFCWFMELNKNKPYSIVVNGVPLDFSVNIKAQEEFELVYAKTDVTFKIKYVQWKETLHKELSKYYFLTNGQEIYKDYTTLNKKSDDYFHSVYIESDFFRNFDFKSFENEGQVALFGAAKSSPEYRYLMKELTDYLKAKRKPFLKEYANKLIDSYEQDGIFPAYQTEWEYRFKKPELTEVIKALYEVEPKLFSSLSINQKKTFVRFLDLLLNSNERESVFSILDEVVELDPEEREELASLFEFTRLSRITDTIKLLQERFEVYYKLKDLVFNESLHANEVNHLQKMIEQHYWIFGEQYHLVTAAEPKFEKALRRYINLLTDKDEPVSIDHPHKQKEMDIFACRQNKTIDRIENIVVELKHPKISLGASQYNQVCNYLDVILKQPEFNAPNMFWEFYLIGSKFDTSNFIRNQISTNRSNGQQSLVLMLEEGRIKFFVKTWSEVFADFEIKHKHLDSQLQLEREKLFNKHTTADSTVASASTV